MSCKEVKMTLKQKLENKRNELWDLVQELTDEQGYWGEHELLVKIELLDELLED